MNSDQARSDRGSTAIIVVLFSVGVFALAGLVVDLGAVMNANLRAADIAEQAARAGADTIDEDRLRETGEIQIRDAGVACARARNIVGAHQEASAVLESCAVEGGQRVTVSVKTEWKAIFLAVAGFEGGIVSAEVTAGPETGVG